MVPFVKHGRLSRESLQRPPKVACTSGYEGDPKQRGDDCRAGMLLGSRGARGAKEGKPGGCVLTGGPGLAVPAALATPDFLKKKPREDGA